jgi:hypothetical protein
MQLRVQLDRQRMPYTILSRDCSIPPIDLWHDYNNRSLTKGRYNHAKVRKKSEQQGQAGHA